MIEYLEELLEEGHQEPKVLALCEELLSNGTNSPREVLAIQIAILRARVTSGQDELAVQSGQMAVELSRELGEWDYFGIACMFLGTAYGVIGQQRTACQILEDFVRHLHLYDRAKVYQMPVWYNLGVFNLAMNSTNEASRAFAMAVKTSATMQNPRRQHGLHQALIYQYLITGEIDKIPVLLSKCSRYIRNYPTPSELKSSKLFHIESRANFAVTTQRPWRSEALLTAGLMEAERDYRHLATLHLALARIMLEEGHPGQVLEHGLVARYFAKGSKRSDLEAEVSEFLSTTLFAE